MLPKPLLDDIVNGRSLPFIGAGFSRNAIVSGGGTVPLYAELGKALSSSLTDFEYISPIDAVSAYEQAFSRVRLVEELSKLLHADTAQPGPAHVAFARLPFDVVATTNFDFVLERAYAIAPRLFRPIMNEDQLSVSGSSSHVDLLKIHGDLHNPSRLVATEEDYDAFLLRYPLLATYLANILIRRSALFIGYSLDDPNLRQILQLLRERLGVMQRQAYAITVGASPDAITRYARRRISVINLPGSSSKYSEIFSELFDQLNDFWTRDATMHALPQQEDESSAQLVIPKESANRLCFFAVPSGAEGAYRSSLSGIAASAGFVPLYGSDLGSSANYMARLAGSLQKIEVFVADVTTPNTLYELRLFRQLNVKSRAAVLILTDGRDVPEADGDLVVTLPPDRNLESPAFLEQVRRWFSDRATALENIYAEEPSRLFNAGEYQAAVISVFTELEVRLRDALGQRLGSSGSNMRWSLRSLFQEAATVELVPGPLEQYTELIRLRNQVIHAHVRVGKREALAALRAVRNILQRLPPLS